MPKHFWPLIVLAAVGFGWVFGCPHGNFWIKITVTVCALCTGAWRVAGVPCRRSEWRLNEVLIGVGAAILLYGIFWAGDALAAAVFGFAPKQVEAIYAIRELGHPWVVGAVLLLVTSPGEELFWRGYVQGHAVLRWGSKRGFAIAALLYGAVHLVSGNVMLVLAALVAGLFWCALYAWRGNLTACIVSHALWTVGVFLLFPIR
ncbi:MAG TPA: CPBP family intramembrane metalloprotease [Kiritimatiellia bacterium]|nr:CPBP family intramembrane metalloprotease [Kiritimatiellia bacterium]HRU70435.1 CPBP family intramembrane metalloprotease [Kiritimatiellia bacterium]